MKFISEARQETIDAMKHERTATDGQFKAILIGFGALALTAATALGIDTYQDIQDRHEHPCDINSGSFDASEC